MAVRDILSKLIDRLPRGIGIYDRDPDNMSNNVRHILNAFAEEDDLLWEILRETKQSRFLDEAAALFDEQGIDSWVLELLVFWVGVTRKEGWDDAKLIREFDIAVYEQESWGNFNQIKYLMNYYFSERYPESRVLTPEVEVTFSDVDSPTFSNVPTLHTGDRVVTGDDIFIFENKKAFPTTFDSPLKYPYLNDQNGKPHSRYGIFSNIHFICIPHEAVPKKLNDAFLPGEAPPDGMGGKLWNSVIDLRHGVNRGLVGVDPEGVDLAEMDAFAQRISQAHIHTVIWAYGGFIPMEAPSDGMGGKLFNSVTDPVHGVGGLVDGDVSRLVQA